ncbi:MULTISPECIES: c-type cytochrome [Nitrospirillum]|uniref:Methanol metabolism-related c-type cytochrome n=1 Tax=Nitrospirillum amazonense TaxID=28077 RepID=A0A560GTB2_9PROT|nr:MULTISPECIES: cytochrome c [Nitrospirillum]MDZ5645917.1 cytochrome c [Nitrospirillum sp. BR 11828]MEE3627663.1 cytochrome c [Nitrospirillum sp. BR 11752]TWB37218.1 methanol metabolism-related c-type cytochrome [Nitrospirillum amazonense]
MPKRLALTAAITLMALPLCVAAGAAGAADGSAPTAAKAAEAKPYKVEGGKVDPGTYNGYRRYGESCMRCHGPDGAGSSYAPDLTDSLKHMDYDAFAETVINGRKNVNTANNNVMPSFGTTEDVANYLDDIYGYLKARSDGALGRGRPQRIGD